MGNKIPSNPPAFPNSEQCLDSYGMNLRDYFAAKAMQGFLANSVDCNQGYQPSWTRSNAEIAQMSYETADAMLKEREKI